MRNDTTTVILPLVQAFRIPESTRLTVRFYDKRSRRCQTCTLTRKRDMTVQAKLKEHSGHYFNIRIDLRTHVAPVASLCLGSKPGKCPPQSGRHSRRDADNTSIIRFHTRYPRHGATDCGKSARFITTCSERYAKHTLRPHGRSMCPRCSTLISWVSNPRALCRPALRQHRRQVNVPSRARCLPISAAAHPGVSLYHPNSLTESHR